MRAGLPERAFEYVERLGVECVQPVGRPTLIVVMPSIRPDSNDVHHGHTDGRCRHTGSSWGGSPFPGEGSLDWFRYRGHCAPEQP